MSHKAEETFAAIEAEFRARVERMVWCSVATVDGRNRPVSRVLHPIWEMTSEGPVAWVATYRHSLKSRHLARNPYVSLAYVAEWRAPVYVDGVASWDDDPATKAHVWNLFLTTPEPVGYDPAPLFHAPDHSSYGALRVDPLKITLATLGADPWLRTWRSEEGRGET